MLIKRFLQDTTTPSQLLKGNLNKPQRQRQQERQKTKGLMSPTMALQVRFDDYCVDLERHSYCWCLFTIYTEKPVGRQ